MKHNDIEARFVVQLDIFHLQRNYWFYLAQLQCDFPSCVVSNLLANDLQCCRGNAKDQPTSSGVEECASRAHTILQLARCLLQLQFTGFVFVYQRLDVIYGNKSPNFQATKLRTFFQCLNSLIIFPHPNPSASPNAMNQDGAAFAFLTLCVTARHEAVQT